MPVFALLLAGAALAPLRAVAGAGVATNGVAATPDAPSIPRAVCAPGPDYYAFRLFTTKNLPGTGYATGMVEATWARTPFSIALAPDGSYVHDLHLSLERMNPPREGVLVAWVATTELDRVERMGSLDQHLTARGQVSWNKYIVAVSLEQVDDPDQERWEGPIVLRGMSRSGMMHTMAGHGAFQQENCAAYGYGN